MFLVLLVMSSAFLTNCSSLFAQVNDQLLRTLFEVHGGIVHFIGD